MINWKLLLTGLKILIYVIYFPFVLGLILVVGDKIYDGLGGILFVILLIFSIIFYEVAYESKDNNNEDNEDDE